MRFAVVYALFAATVLLAEPRTQRMLERIAEEASAFEQKAPNLIAEETLRQRALKIAKKRFRAVDAQPAKPEIQSREIRSEYAFSSSGNPPDIREIRRVLSVDGKTVNTSENAVRDLMRSLRAHDDKSRKKLLEDFEKHGLVGTVTDFGQLLLLFTRRNQELYEFSPSGDQLLGAQRCNVFAYRQLDGPGTLTIFDEKGRVQPRTAGEIWVASDSFRVMRITMKAIRGEGKAAIRDEAEVNYTMSVHGVVTPAAVIHREYQNGQLTAENQFSYAPFRKFGSSADIQFNTTSVPDTKQ